MEKEDAPQADRLQVAELQEQLEVLRIGLADAKAEVRRHTYLPAPAPTSTFGGKVCELHRWDGSPRLLPALDRLLTALSCSCRHSTGERCGE